MTMDIYNKQHEEHIREMQDYIASFKQMDKDTVQRKAKESLMRSGVLNADGTLKEKICQSYIV